MVVDITHKLKIPILSHIQLILNTFNISLKHAINNVVVSFEIRKCLFTFVKDPKK